MKQIIFLFLSSLLFSSCGIFLQKTGVKSFSPNEKISQKRLNRYQYDFLYLSKLVDEGFPKLDSIFPKKERQKQIDQTLKTLEGTDNKTDFVIQARKYLSYLKNQHTTITLRSELKEVFPYVVYISQGDWYLLNISKQYDSLQIGKKIVEINGLPTSEVEQLLIDFTFAENKINQQFDVLDLGLYNNPHYLKQIGVIKQKFESLKLKFGDSTKLELSLISTDKEIKVYNVLVKSNPITRYRNETYRFQLYKEENFGYLQFNRAHDKIDILDGLESYVKPWLQPIARAYVKKQFKKEKPSKAIASFYNPKHPIFNEFVWALVDSLNDAKVENLIVDLRHNPGGNTNLGIQLMYFLTDKDTLKNFSEYVFTSAIYKTYFREEYQGLMKKYPKGIPQRDLLLTNSGEDLFSVVKDRNSKYFIKNTRPLFKGSIYILSNQGTGSAAALLATLFQDNGIGTVIGVSVGNNPIGATTYTPMKLPKTKAKISIASTYIERPKKERGVIQMPDVWIENTIDDLITGRDPHLEAVRKKIASKPNR